MSFESGSAPSQKKVEKLKIAIVDTSDALESQARDIAEERLTASKAELKGVRGFFSKIWKHNLAREYYRQQEIAKGKAEIVGSGNLYVGENAAQEIHAEAMNAVVDRFIEEYEEVIHKEAGEERRTVNREGEDAELNASVRTLVREYASGSIDEEAFNAERSRIIAYGTGLTGEQLASAVQHTDNIFEIAKQAKIAVEHGASLDELDQSIEIVIGKAKTGVRTEAQFNTVDRIAKKMQSSWIGKYVNETTIASGVAIAYATAIGLSQRLASSKAFAWGTFGASALVGGAVAGMRESVRIEEERQQHARERAKGKEIVPDSARRNEMEGVIHGTVPAGELTHRLKNIPEVFESEEEYFAALNVLAQTESRIRLSDTEKIDLLSYTDFGSIEQERLTLDIARATAKVRLRNAVQDGAVATPDGATFDDLYQAALTAHTTEIRTGEGGIEAMDRCFSKMKRRKVAGAVGKAVLTGLAVGGVVQEAAAFAHESREGVVEHMFHAQGAKAPDAVTALEGLRRWVTSEVPLGRIVSNTILPDGSHVALPDGVELIHNPLNVAEYTLIKDGEVIPGKLEFQQGVLTKASEDILAQHGVSLEKHINHFQSQQDTQLPVRTFVEQNTDLFHKISRKFWYDNDTSPFDKNELRLRWGGQNGMGIDSSGKYVFNIGSMTQDGSQSNQMSVDAQDAVKNGKLKLLLSLSKDSQSSVVEVPIDAEGNAVIDPQSKIGKLFFKQEGGKLSFVGKFAEIAHEVGTTKTGVPQFGILATHIGEGVSHVMDQVFTHAEIPVSRFGVNDTEPFIEPPIVVPLFGRRPLERLNTMREPSVGAFDDFENDESGNASRPSGGTSQSHGGDSTDVHEPQPPTMSAPYGFRETNVFEYGYNGLSYITRKEYEHRMSDTLRSDPDAKLDEQTEINGYFSRLEKEYMSMVDVLSRQAGPMNPECMLTVCIPVAGHQEGKNIYKTLENYLNQTADKAVFEIVLFVNQPDVDTEGSPIVADETFAEIERFMKDNPGIHIAVMQSVIPREKVQIGYIRKLLNDAVLKRNIGRTKKENSDHIMVSNDADNKGMSYEYIQNFINKFKSAPSTDAFMGQLDWDPVSYVRNPLVHIGTRLFQYVDLQIRRKDTVNIASSGANFAFRSGVYAAVGGYSSHMGLAEDVDLGKAMKAGRMGARNARSIQYAGARVSRMFTSSRRAEKAIKDGLAPVEQWRNGFSAFDDEVRKMDWERQIENIDFNKPEDVQLLTERVEYIVNRTIHAMTWAEGDQEIFKRALSWLGIRYVLTEKNEIHIVDAGELIKGLKTYQIEAKNIIERKTKGSIKYPGSSASAENNNNFGNTETQNTHDDQGDGAQEAENSSVKKEVYETELKQATAGTWEREKSHFWAEYVTAKVSGKRSVTVKYFETLEKQNSEVLGSLFDEEGQRVQRGDWKAEESFFRNDPNRVVTGDLGRRRKQYFDQLMKSQEHVRKERVERQEQQILKSFKDTLEKELDSVKDGIWNQNSSFFEEFVKNPHLGMRVRVEAERAFRSLKEAERRYVMGINERERRAFPGQYRKEKEIAEKGKWIETDSYFVRLKKELRYKKFDERLREQITQAVLQLRKLNFESRPQSRTESAPKTVAEARVILGVTDELPFAEAKKAYRRLVRKYHPDMSGESDEEKREATEKMALVNAAWGILEQDYISKSAGNTT